MAINPNIPLSLKADRTGQIISGGIQDILQDRDRKKQQGIQNEQQNRLLSLREEDAEQKRQQFATKQQELVEGKLEEQVGLDYQSTIKSLYEKKDFDGVTEFLNTRIQEAGPESPIGQAYTNALGAHQRDPLDGQSKFQRIHNQAVFKGRIPGNPKGKRINAQDRGGGSIFPAIETPEGKLQDPSTGKLLPNAIKAPNRTAQGKADDFGLGKKAINTIEDNLIKAQEGLARLDDMQAQFNPKFLQAPARFSNLVSQIQEKAGFELDPEDKQELTEFASFKRTASSNLNLYVKEITGAQMSEAEVGRLKQATPDPGTGITDGDSPTVYKSKMDESMRTLRAAQKRFMHLRENGFRGQPFDGEITNDMANVMPLSGFMEKGESQVIDTQEAFDALESGEKYTGTDGQTYEKP